MKYRTLFILCLICALLLSGCGAQETAAFAEPVSAVQETAAEAAQPDAAEVPDDSGAAEEAPEEKPEEAPETAQETESAQPGDDMFTSRDYENSYDAADCIPITLMGDTAQCDAAGVSISGSTVTITGEGEYLISGSLSNGMILVEVGDTEKVRLILNGVTIRNETSAAIYVREADKVFVTTAPNSENNLVNGGTYEAIDDSNIDAVIFSRADLTLNGAGTLTLEAAAGHGVVSKDDLAMTGGTYEITAASHGLSGKDSVRIAGGSVTVTAGKDGIHAENADDATQGFVYLSGGTISITAQGDGISAGSTLQAEGGEVTILAGSGSEASAANAEESQKGVKTGSDLQINGGSYTVDAADDALHAGGNLEISGGQLQLATGDDGAHAEANLTVSGGTISITESYEGIEGQSIDISGGEIRLVSRDDGINAAGGNDQSGMESFGQAVERFDTSYDAYLHISGGVVYINANGDGVDSNGSLEISGGEIYVAGPVSSGNGCLDYNVEGTITGGLFVAAGTAQMAQNFGGNSTQGAILVSTGSQEAGSTVELTDGAGNVLLSWTAEKSYDSVLVSCPEILQGETYTLSAGSFVTEITMDTLIYGAGTGGMGGKGGRGGF